MNRFWLILMAAALLCSSFSFGQSAKKGKEQSRSVQGSVTAPDDAVAAGAIVYLENTKTLQVRSFITQKDGTYYFHELSPDVDYKLWAEHRESPKEAKLSSKAKTLSSFDTRKDAVINLKLNPAK